MSAPERNLKVKHISLKLNIKCWISVDLLLIKLWNSLHLFGFTEDVFIESKYTRTQHHFV